MIHVCYALYDRHGTYSKFVGASMCSLFENTREPVTIHILHDETLTELNRKKFVELTAAYNQTVEFHRATLNDEVNELMKMFTFSPASLYRLQMGELLPPTVEKAIYFDADIIIDLDVKELWDEIGDEDFFGAVLDAGIAVEEWQAYKRFAVVTKGYVRREDYFNSGVWAVNLKKLRAIKNFNRTMIEKYYSAPKDFPAYDQCTLNYFYSTHYKKLPKRYNLQLVMERRMGLRKSEQGGAVCHYICRSLSARSRDEFDQLFWHYFVKTPWFDEKFFLRAIEGFQAAAATQQTTLMKALYTCREKIFWAPECLTDRLRDQLTALGIDEESIRRDYLLTNEFTGQILRKFEAMDEPPFPMDIAREVFLVYEENLRSYRHCVELEYGSVSNYLELVLGIGPDEIETLERCYLEY